MVVLAFVLGVYVGSTFTSISASIGSSVAAKRTAFTHVIFNVIGVFIFLLLLSPFTLFVGYLQTQFNLNPEMTLAFAHGSYNISNTIIQFPFIAMLAWLVTKLIP